MQLPEIIKKFNSLDFDYAGGEGYDYEPFNEFLSKDKTLEWIHAWTGNTKIQDINLLVFGMDGSGGYACIWSIQPELPILEQPIVFIGSEGEIGVVADNFYDFLWVFADGYGPCEVINRDRAKDEYRALYVDFANHNSITKRKQADEIVDNTKSKYPDFDKFIDDLCE